MTMTWTLTLRCDACGAHIRFENERPDWQRDEAEIDQSALDEARTFIANYPSLRFHPWPPGFRAMDGTMVELPHYVHCPVDLLGPTTTELCPPVDSDLYVVCPACDGRAWQTSGLSDNAEGDQVEAAAR